MGTPRLVISSRYQEAGWKREYEPAATELLVAVVPNEAWVQLRRCSTLTVLVGWLASHHQLGNEWSSLDRARS